MCIRDLRIYAESLNGKLSYYRDKNDFEVDCIIIFDNGKWGTIENINTDKYEKPSFLMILTSDEYSYKREDGVYVVSIGTLKG